MSVPLAARPHAGVPAAARPVAACRERWGWLEVVLLAQTVLPALMFVPGLTRLRTLSRVAAFLVPLAAWASVALGGRRPIGRPFAPRAWLSALAAWLVLMLAHPSTNSIMSGAAEVAMLLAVMSPAFWVGPTVRSPERVRRLLAVLFLCNAAGALVGIGQFYRPDRFNPPAIHYVKQDSATMLEIETDDGRRVVRPCGLTDSPGGGAAAGQMTALLGLCWALQPIRRWKRLAALGLAVIGVAVIYLSQGRGMLITLVICVLAILGLLVWRRDFKKATLLAGFGSLALGGAFAWILRHGGQKIAERFVGLVSTRPDKLYMHNRGAFLFGTFNEMAEYPLGAGLGRWGQAYGYFGDHTPSPQRGLLWVEIQLTAWLYDGGVVMIVLYSIAILAALAMALRVGRTSPSEDLRFWAMAVCAYGLSNVVFCLSFPVFLSPTGLQFWALFAALHAADQAARALATARPGAPVRAGVAAGTGGRRGPRS